MYRLDKYQTEIIDAVALKTKTHRKIVLQLPTGAGKTVCFASLCNRWISKLDSDVLIVVHREELMRQTQDTLFNWHHIKSTAIAPFNKKPESARVYVGMVETVNNRLKSNANYFRNVGLIIIDEAHIGSFTKIHDFFPEAKIIGVTATPISSNKKKPMNSLYEDIVCGVDIPFLIKLHDNVPERGLVPCVTFAPKNITKKDFHIVGGEYDQHEMSEVYSNSRHVQNTVEKYKKHALGKKTLVFNCSIEHSILVNKAFLAAGFDSRHLDSEKDSDYRRDTLAWFKNTPGAILNNIGIVTTGFDEPSVEGIIPNKSTKSKSLWLQICGRGGRPFLGKKYFIIIDMGDNVTEHLEWSDPFDWEWEFHNPGVPKKAGSGVAAIKTCETCEGIIPIQARKCKWCDAIQPEPTISYDERLGEFVIVTKNMDVKKLIAEDRVKLKSDGKPMSVYLTLHRIKSDIVIQAKNKLKLSKIDDNTAYKLLSVYQEKVAEWCKEMKKPYNAFHKRATGEWMLEEMGNVFGWKPPELTL